MYFDLSEPNLNIDFSKYECVILCAAITNIAQCESEPEKCERINSINTIALIEKCVASKCFVIFLSSNAVFDGKKPFYKHTDTTSPTTKYGEFKLNVEKYIQDLPQNDACVLRLTKVITDRTPFIQNWKAAAENGNEIKAFSNRLISPIDIEDVVDSIQLLVERKNSGIFQLGSSEEISFYEFAKKIFTSEPNTLSKIVATQAPSIESNIAYNSLAMNLPTKEKNICQTKQDNNYLDSSIVFSEHKDKNLINEIQKDIFKYFINDDNFYLDLPIEIYREIVKDTQDHLNEKEYARKICEQCLKSIQEYIEEDKFFIQTNLYLRATRPILDMESESIGWHRETFYGANMEKSVNIWTPILGVNEKNTLRFIPNSQDICESDILVNQINDKVTVKGSTGNKIGFLYSPKIIVGGVDLEKSTPMNVPNFNSALFSGLLIHGAAQNFSQNIRFSLDFRVLPFSAYDSEKSKTFHITSNKPYFELY